VTFLFLDLREFNSCFLYYYSYIFNMVLQEIIIFLFLTCRNSRHTDITFSA